MFVVRALVQIVLTVVVATATFTAGIFILGALNIIHPATAAAAPAAPVAAAPACSAPTAEAGMHFDDCAKLDGANIDDLRTAEDDPAWDCRTMGDHVCGPDNSQGVEAGVYSHNVRYMTWEQAQAHRELS
jgi:hypothetical protein